MGVVDEAVENGVGIGRVADDGVPVFDGELAGDDGGSAAVAFLEDFEKVVAGLGVEGLEPQSSRMRSWTPPSARVRRA
jgi:hypothetical protein